VISDIPESASRRSFLWG